MSSLIAIVLLVGMVIVFSVVIFKYSDAIVSNIIGRSDAGAEKAMSCLNDVEFVIKNGCYDIEYDREDIEYINVKILVENKANKDLEEGFLARVYYVNGSVMSGVSSPVPPVLSPYSAGEISIFIGDSIPVEVEITPKLRIGKEVVNCDGKAQNIDVQECN